MRLLKIGVYYPAYLEQLYAARPGLASASYREQHAALMGERFGSSDFWTRALDALGYETCELVANAEPLQRAWAAEHGFAVDEDWLFPITAAQVRAFSPEVLLVADYTTMTAAFLRHLKESCPSIRLVLGWCGAPYRDGSVFGECHLVLSCVPELVTHFRESGHRSRHVNHAFEPRILEELKDDAGKEESPVRPADFVFLGSVVKSRDFHLERELILRRLVEETSLQIFSNISTQAATVDDGEAQAGRMRAGRGARLASVPILGRAARQALQLVRGFGTTRRPAPQPASPAVDERILRRSRPPLFGLDMFRQLRASRVALNTHIDISPQSASNMRLFEATGVGTCLLTDWKANLPDLFEPDVEVVTYRDAAECVERVKYLIDHEQERSRVAAAGQRRTLRDHTFADRALRIDAIIREELSNS